MTQRDRSLVSLSPQAIRALIAARCWRDVMRIEHEISLTEYRTRTKSGLVRAKKEIRRELALKAIEFVREPGLYLDTKSNPPVSGNQYSLWSTISTHLRSPEAVVAAKRWACDRNSWVRRLGAMALCTLAPAREMELCLRLVRDSDDMVACEAVYGFAKAFKHGLIPRSARSKVEQFFRSIASGESALQCGRSATCRVPNVLLKASVARGIAFLGSSRVIRCSNPALQAALSELTSFQHIESGSYRKLLRDHVDVQAIWRLYDDWKCGRVIISRKSVRGERTDDAIAGQLLMLAAFVDAKRTRDEIPAFCVTTKQDREIVQWHIEDVQKAMKKR